jgi:hypothetical protein
MAIFGSWCDLNKDENSLKRYWTLVEKAGGRDVVRASLAETMRSHYGRLDRIADDIARLGYEKAAEILRTVLPQSATARSGELGEILATELVEEQTGFNVPVRRLRYKDGREMALRGDDFIGVRYDKGGRLWLLKGEAKSNQALDKTTIADARETLNRFDGRCTPVSLLFVANHLLDSNDEDDISLGRTMRDEVGCKALRPNRIDHMLFTLSGNNPPSALKEDLIAASADRNQYVVNFHIEDHQKFIAAMFEEAQNLGDS